MSDLNSDDDQHHQMSEGMIEHLQVLLNELESAGGAPDSEARQALLRLQASLQTLEAAKAGAFDHIDPSDIPSTTTTVDNNEVSIPQQMETLQGRVGNLERRLEELPPGTKEILGSAAGEWIDEQLHNVGNLEGDGVGEVKGTTQQPPPSSLPPS